MKELQEIAWAWEALRRQGQSAALATVVRVDGSAYRRPGARMLVEPDGQTVGSVSGGCLEADVVLRAQRVRETEESAVVTYDTTDDSDILLGVGLGCRGVVRVLIERLSPQCDDAITLPAGLLRGREASALATVYHAEGATGLRVGERLLLGADGREIGHPALRAGARRALDAGKSACRTIRVAGGHAEVFFEVIWPPRPLVIFGAGQDAQPLARLAKEVGWHVTVADSRPALAVPSRFPEADAVLVSPRDGLPASLALDERTAAVVMTHNYLQDRALLAALLPSPVWYLGVLGPKRRTELLLAELREDGLIITDAMRARLHGPVGLDIGAETPEGIALAIVAEIQAMATGRAGGLLRERSGPLYSPADEDAPCPTSP
ncbi:MAG: XdhC family protein [Armatimonadetes bacterium]|nr:XdhC family protein [Armatimonadota bacterium]